MRLGACGKGGHVFVPRVQPLDAAMAAQRVGEAVEAVADNALNPLPVGRGQHLNHLVRYCASHACLS